MSFAIFGDGLRHRVLEQALRQYARRTWTPTLDNIHG
jgi:hypothetical protein